MKNDKSKNIIIVLLVVIIIILGALVVLFATDTISINSNKVNDNNVNENVGDNNGETEDSNDNNLQESKYATWMNYILEQNITNINIDRSGETDNLDEYHTKTNLTIEQLKGLFSKLMNYKLIKSYSSGGGFTYGDIITISYSLNNNNYSLQIANGFFWVDEAKEVGLLNAFENSDHIVGNEEDKNMEGVYYSYMFQGYDKTILDDYFK